MFSNWKKKRYIKKFLTVLPSELASRYGAGDFYTKGQVKTTLKALGFGETYSGYALAIFLSQNDGVEALSGAEIYNAIRKEVADLFFNGHLDFKFQNTRFSKIGNSGHCSTGAVEAGSSD